jgi:hypothetical protein
MRPRLRGRKGEFMLKVLFKIIKVLAVVWVVLFTVFFFDLDGKFLYYVWEPMIIKRFDNMKRPDLTGTPYEKKEPV